MTEDDVMKEAWEPGGILWAKDEARKLYERISSDELLVPDGCDHADVEEDEIAHALLAVFALGRTVGLEKAADTVVSECIYRFDNVVGSQCEQEKIGLCDTLVRKIRALYHR